MLEYLIGEAEVLVTAKLRTGYLQIQLLHLDPAENSVANLWKTKLTCSTPKFSEVVNFYLGCILIFFFPASKGIKKKGKYFSTGLEK